MLIYIADDEKLALSMLERTIKEWNKDVEIQCFSRAADLLAATKAKLPDVIFTDIMMPGMSGLVLAEELNKVSNRLNIIFVTGYTEYSMEALNLFVSGYVNKPISLEDIKKQMSHLRYPVSKAPQIYAKTFGLFSLTIDGKPISFSRKKAMETIAYLVDRDGSVVSRQDLSYILFNDESFSRSVQRNLCNVISALEKDLETAGASDIFIHETHGYSINKSVLKSDYFDYLNGDKSLYHGEYMEQYSFGEDFKGLHMSELK